MGRSTLETEIQRQIEIALGAEPDLLLIRNHCGMQELTRADGRVVKIPFGLGTGSPDLVGILNGRWFCMEVKRFGERPTPEQEKCHALWRRFGALVYVVRSVQDAKEALADARRTTA